MPTSTISNKTKIRMSVDDGCASDVSVAKLARKYKIETTFYWPVEWHSLAYDKGYEPLRFVDAKIIAGQHEVGAHTITHRHLTKIPERDAHEEIYMSGVMLKEMLGLDRTITKFCPPRGYTNPALTDYTLKFYKSQRLTKGPGLVHVHPDSGANDNRPWRECITPETKEIWGHSHEFDRFDLWDELEEFLSENLHRK